MWRIMCNYYKVHQWHINYDHSKATPTFQHNNENDIKFNRSYIKQKLDSGLTKLWMVYLIIVINSY